MLFIGLVVGIILGALMMCFIIGASRLNREDDIYMQGYLAGQEDKKEGVE